MKPMARWSFGVLSIAPLASIIVAFWAAYEFGPSSLTTNAFGFLGWGTLALAMVASFIHLFRYNTIAWPGKILWAAVLLMMNLLALPLYWLTFVLPENKVVPR